jgi:hypothetical protein
MAFALIIANDAEVTHLAMRWKKASKWACVSFVLVCRNVRREGYGYFL